MDVMQPLCEAAAGCVFAMHVAGADFSSTNLGLIAALRDEMSARSSPRTSAVACPKGSVSPKSRNGFQRLSMRAVPK
jgi:hypothetical protein